MKTNILNPYTWLCIAGVQIRAKLMLKCNVPYVFALNLFALFRPYAEKKKSHPLLHHGVWLTAVWISLPWAGSWRLCEAGWSSRWLQIPCCKCPVIYCHCRDSALLVPFIKLSSDCEKRLERYPLLETNTKRNGINYVSVTTATGVVNENGWQTGADPVTPYLLFYLYFIAFLLTISPPVLPSSVPALFHFTFL